MLFLEEGSSGKSMIAEGNLSHGYQGPRGLEKLLSFPVIYITKKSPASGIR
jgi:hypothetical protein